ncbi:ABC transporter substrate-binding protein [Nocardiopsis sp. RSe5-2]|uniref:ABC transporter substrate-binding protein n=1 Tax=Nocardiopsis endophytica TaxID=3018445 RepID=A0ABT4U239_9ACTN|nr:ABC transporter substrate-binding protein [Nocardiopsis endophytica]MDA2811006.1 ABC transporter substrate-binding protein [Nocardiopsis endophytica]
MPTAFPPFSTRSPRPSRRPVGPGRAHPGALRGAAAAAALALAAGAAAPAAAEAASPEGDTLTVAISQPVDTLNPFLAQLLISTSIHKAVYEPLVAYDAETNEPTGAVAESWETSEDGLTWTFTIREGMTWSDGEPVTAEDPAFTYNAMMEDEEAATANGNAVANFETVTAVDDSTLRIELEEPQATMLSLDAPIVPEHVWSGVDDFGDFTNEDFPIVGSGPFTITGHEPNQSITLEANPDYWRGAPEFENLVFRYFADKDAEVEALRKGEVSMVAGLTPAQADSLEGQEGISVNNATGKRFQGFTINPGAETQDGEEFGDGHPALEDKTLRQAIMRAIDKDELVEKVYGGYAEPAEGYIPARYDRYYWEPSEEERLDFDVDAANEMLDEAGYKEGDDGIRVSPDGDRLELRMHVHNDRPDYVAMGKIFVERLADIGIEVDNQTVDPGVLSDALYDAEYDLIWTGWSVNPDPDYVLGIHTCDALPEEPGTMRGDAYFCDEQYDELYDKQLAAWDDPDQRAEYVKDMQQILYEEAVVNVVTYANTMEAYRSDQISSTQVQPDPGGNLFGQDGHWSFSTAVPAEGGQGGGSLSGGMIAGIAGAVVVVAGAIGFLVWRRRTATAEDRE